MLVEDEEMVLFLEKEREMERQEEERRRQEEERQRQIEEMRAEAEEKVKEERLKAQAALGDYYEQVAARRIGVHSVEVDVGHRMLRVGAADDDVVAGAPRE